MSNEFQDYLLGLAFWGSVLALGIAFDFYYRPSYAGEEIDPSNKIAPASLGILLQFLLAKPTGMALGLLARL